MQVAQPGTVIDKLYQEWQRNRSDWLRACLALSSTDGVLVYSPEHIESLVEDYHRTSGAVQASKHALAIVLHARREHTAGNQEFPLRLGATDMQWTYGDHLAHDYDQAVALQRHLARVGAA